MRCSRPTPRGGVWASALVVAAVTVVTAAGQTPPPANSPSRSGTVGTAAGQFPPPAAGQTSPPTNTPAIIPEIEKAGKAVQEGKIDEGLKLLQEAAKKHPTLPPAKLMLARLLVQARETLAQGRAYLEQAAGENPDHPFVYLSNADLALNEGRFTDALLNCQRALDLSAA